LGAAGASAILISHQSGIRQWLAAQNIKLVTWREIASTIKK